MSLPGPGNEQVIIIKKRRKKGHEGHHGGSWKVAYADFVTAMMAFFLLLWLLNVTTAEQKRGIADYFAPVSISKSTSGSGGILGGQTITAPGASLSSTAPLAPDVPVVGPPGIAADPNQESEDTSDPTYPRQKEGETREAYLRRMAKVVLKQQPDETTQEFLNRVKSAGLDKLAAELEAKTLSDAQLQQALADLETRQFQATAQQIRQAIQSIPDLKPLAENVLLDQTPDGLRIQIVDQEKQTMFPSGSSQMYPQTRQLLGLVAQAIGRLPNKVSISGHTDSTPFARSDVRDNWELSSDRANASRRALVQGGLTETRIQTVVGRADRDHLMPAEPNSPRNRRVSIVLLRENQTGAAAPAVPAATPATPAAAPGQPN